MLNQAATKSFAGFLRVGGGPQLVEPEVFQIGMVHTDVFVISNNIRGKI